MGRFIRRHFLVRVTVLRGLLRKLLDLVGQVFITTRGRHLQLINEVNYGNLRLRK